MKSLSFNILLIFGAAVGCSAALENFDRYQLILDRQPFGQEPPEADVVQIPLNQSFARMFRLSMLYEDDQGILAGFVDSSNSKSYLLRMGQPKDGLELIDADLTLKEATLRNESQYARLKQSPDSDTSAPEPIKKPTSRGNSYVDSRRSRQQAAPAQAPTAPPPPQLTGEALQKHLQNVQMDAIRNGLPPLPMPLTPEMDAQLVSEGILPPQ